MPILTVPGYMSDNDSGVGSEDRFIIQTPTVIGTCFRTLYPNVSLRNQTQEQVFAFNGAHIQRDVKRVATLRNPATIDGCAVIGCYLTAD